MSKTRVPAIEGWFTMDEPPQLLGSRCRACGTYFFPGTTLYCRNPSCDGTELEEAPLSRDGRIWSLTENRYPPPPPYVAAEPFEPYAIAAVELDREKMIVLGQLTPGADFASLKAGDRVELVLGTLYEDEENSYVVWKWKPAGQAAG